MRNVGKSQDFSYNRTLAAEVAFSRMESLKNSRACVMLWIVTLMSIPDIAAAYLDPGTGSMILQGLIALIGGTLATAAIYWRAVTRFIRRLFGRAAGDKSDVSREA